MDPTQRKWAIGSIIWVVVCGVVYGFFAVRAPQGARGGSALGLSFGILGFGFMLFAAALGLRKRVPTWRIGRAQNWMRGHLWIGALSFPMLLLHGGFRFGGTLTRILMWLLIVTIFSGVFGAVLQHYLPRLMTAKIPLETIYDEIGNVRSLLCKEADRDVEAVCGPLNAMGATQRGTNPQRAGGFTAARGMGLPVSGRATAVAAAPELIVLSEEASAPLKRFYLNELRPFLDRPGERRLLLADAHKAEVAFSGLRTLLPTSVHGTLDDLMDICDEARQLRRQEKLHRWLHGWLLVHIPLSLALIGLGAVHAVLALRY